ncbi:MAG TPA: hypothetical protein VNH22_00930 [Blastocatellia bacterium]|jgi:hypothetical protein|nr:hypothetical protein [Blastocatellia bacterium]
MISKIFLASLYLALVFGLAACAKPEQVIKEESAQSLEAGNPPVEVLPPQTNIPQPTVDEVRTCIDRNFQETVRFQPSGIKNFFAGDFNGDGSQDIAAVVKPIKERLPDINSAVANWMIADPVALAARSLGAEARSVSSKPSVTEEDGSLLAVVHGFGIQGWRDPEARQVYLLKNATGDSLRTVRQGEVGQGGSNDGPMPHLYGDIIQQRLAGESGFLYYTGSGYEWFTPRLYRKELPKRSFH